MVYLENFRFPGIGSEETELQRFVTSRENKALKGERNYGVDFYMRSVYPFGLMSGIGLHSLDFEPITILYGGNGSGKSTALNIISNKLQIPRTAPYNTTKLMSNYLQLCDYESNISWAEEEIENIAQVSKMITSDDIFKYMLEKRRQAEKKSSKVKL